MPAFFHDLCPVCGAHFTWEHELKLYAGRLPWRWLE